MNISADDVKYIAKLAKLRFSDEEINKLNGEFESILTHFKSIDKMELDKVDLDQFSKDQKSVVREDHNTAFAHKERLFQNVKSRRGAFIQVPKIIE